MDIEKYLILIKGKDKTKDITSCVKENLKWQVKYSTKNKIYSYNESSVLWLKEPVILSENASIVYQNNYPLSGVINPAIK